MNKPLYSTVLVLLPSIFLVSLLGCKGQASANLRDNFNTLTVEETLGGAISARSTLAIVGRYANVDALPMARNLLASYWVPDDSGGNISLIAAGKDGPESPAMYAAFSGLTLLAYIGNSSDAHLVEQIQCDPAFLRAQLMYLENTSFPTTNILVLGMMAARRVDAAEEIVNKMVTPKYWRDLGVDELAPPASCGLSFAYYLAANSLYAYRIGGDLDLNEKENALLETVENPIQRQILERRIEYICNAPLSEEEIFANSAPCCSGFSVRLFIHHMSTRLFCKKPKFPTPQLRQHWREAYEQNQHLFAAPPSTN